MKSISGTHRALIGLFVMSLITGIFFTNCAKNGFTASNPEQYGEGADPFLAMAWHINNTAQKVFALDAGVAGVDLNLLKTWQSEIFGDGIKILISDDG
ncbi:MAG: hypothetical protein KUL82_02335, partial [Bdellovibrio sp.]|nr:hypothetical protein [Bdellovibrio sp.]